MKRIALVVIFIIGAFMFAEMQPQTLSWDRALFIAFCSSVLLVASLVFLPVTKYITVEKHISPELLNEIIAAKTFRRCIGSYYDRQAKFYLDDGTFIEGELVGRSDSKCTYTVQLADSNELFVFPQGKLRGVSTYVNNTPTVFRHRDRSPKPAAL